MGGAAEVPNQGVSLELTPGMHKYLHATRRALPARSMASFNEAFEWQFFA